jgi:hypothetical protein
VRFEDVKAAQLSLLGGIMIAIKKLLAPTDLGEYSQFALKYAAAFAEAFGAKVYVLHVHEPYPQGAVFEGMVYDSELVANSCATAVNRWRDGIKKVISRLEVAVEHSKVEDWKIRLHKPRDEREGVYDPEVTSTPDADCTEETTGDSDTICAALEPTIMSTSLSRLEQLARHLTSERSYRRRRAGPARQPAKRANGLADARRPC